MSNENLDPVVEKIVDLVADRVMDTFENVNFTLSFDTSLAIARELGYVKANKGRVGGYSPTDEGLMFGGVDKEAYMADKEAQRELSAVTARIASLEKKRLELLNGTTETPVITTPATTEGAEAIQA